VLYFTGVSRDSARIINEQMLNTQQGANSPSRPCMR